MSNLSPAKFKDCTGYLSVEDVAEVIGITLDQMREWIANSPQGPQRIGIPTTNANLVRKRDALDLWYDGLWMQYGFEDWPYPPTKTKWMKKLHLLPVYSRLSNVPSREAP